jgi:hypothetical protein
MNVARSSGANLLARRTRAAGFSTRQQFFRRRSKFFHSRLAIGRRVSKMEDPCEIFHKR